MVAKNIIIKFIVGSMTEKCKHKNVYDYQFSMIGTSTVKEDKLKEALEEFKKIITAARRQDGCLVYEINQDAENPTLIYIHERWRDERA